MRVCVCVCLCVCVSVYQLGPLNVSRASNYFLLLHRPKEDGRDSRSVRAGGQEGKNETRGGGKGRGGGGQGGDDEAVDGRAEDGGLAGIWVLDSGKETCVGSQGWGCVLPDQVSWFQTAARRTGEVPSHMFVHIPVEEALHLWNRHLLHGEGVGGCGWVAGGVMEGR
jgi:hypothetical protein